MRILGTIILFFVAALMQTTGGIVLGSEQKEELRSLDSNEVVIWNNAISVPLGRILLIRKGLEYGAVKFTEAWTGKTEDDCFAKYESYYQGDKTGDFSNKNVKLRKGKLHSWEKRRLFNHTTTVWDYVKCGPMKLLWSYKTWVCFFESVYAQGDYGIELSPTKWTDISEANVFDPRLKWYKYDTKRKRIYIPIDQLWEDREEKK